jgi:phosphohistidine phosphatase
MKLYLVRHGQAHPSDEEMEETLTFEGEANLYFVGRALRKMQLSFNTIYSSSKKRALQTAEILAEKVFYDVDSIIKTDFLKPKADPKEALHFLSQQGKESILCVAHLPILQEIVFESACVGSVISLPFDYGQVICLDFNPSTQEGSIEWLLTPQLCKIMVT